MTIRAVRGGAVRGGVVRGHGCGGSSSGGLALSQSHRSQWMMLLMLWDDDKDKDKDKDVAGPDSLYSRKKKLNQKLTEKKAYKLKWSES